MMNVIKRVTTIFLLCIAMSLNAQFQLDAEIRPRFEYRHGFKTLFPDNADPAAFVSQRTRLNGRYSTEKLDFYLSLQDVRVWGDVPQLNTFDKNQPAIHQAWAKINLSENFALKLGRQEVVYDDSRIFGNVAWVQQARSHDLAIVKYQKGSSKLDLGFAFNQPGESLTGTTLTTPNTYKAFQYAWFHNNWDSFGASVLFLNNGLQFIDAANADNNETRYSQTLGTRLTYKTGSFGISSNLYYQFGSDVMNNDLSAYLLSLDIAYKASANISFGAGLEVISGNDDGAPSNGENKAFTPLYGTNHKFNGLMDYFYVGNHANNVGLQDIQVNAKFKLNPKSSLMMAFHNFSSATDLPGTSDKQLGSELDMVYARNIMKDVGLKMGYSHLFASDGMEVLKNNTDGNTNNWGWVMITIKPTLFKSSSQDQ